jgi:hypothetical protein
MLSASASDGWRKAFFPVPRRRPGSRSADGRFFRSGRDRLRLLGPGLRRGTGIDPRKHSTRHSLCIGVEDDFGKHAGSRSRHFLCDLVGLELDQRLVLEHQIANLPKPGADNRLGAFLLLGNDDVDQL